MTTDWFAEAETLKTQALTRLAALSPEEQRHPPAPDAWSAAQVVAHLVIVEELLVDEWHPTAKNAPGTKPSLLAALIAAVASAGMRGPFRMPTIAALDPNAREPDGSGDLETLAARWGTVRERMRNTFPAQASALWIIHPMFGALTCPQFGAFLVAHLQHHLNHWPVATPPRGKSAGNESARQSLTSEAVGKTGNS